MKPAGLTEINCLFNPIVLLFRELRRTDSRERNVFYAEDSEISLHCALPKGAQTIAPNVRLVNEQANTKPGIGITGEDDLNVRCRFVRVRYQPDSIELIFTPELSYSLDLTPVRTREGLKLPQIKTVFVETDLSRFTVDNPDFLQGSGRPLWTATPSSG